MALTTTQKTEAYQFFIVAFGAATGVEYMNQLNDAYGAGMTTKQIVNVYATKPQFEALYPRFLTNEQFGDKLIENVVGASATAAAKTEAKADVAAALNAGWTKGDVVFQIFTNLAAKASTDVKWGNTSLMLANKVAVAQYVTETLLVNTTDLAKLGGFVANVTEVAASVDTAKLAAQGANGQTFTLTTGVDSFTGGAGADKFIADNAGTDTISAADTLDGGAGTDTLNVYSDGAAFSLPTLTSIETLNVFDQNASLNISTSQFASVTTANFTRTDGDLTLTLGSGVTSVALSDMIADGAAAAVGVVVAAAAAATSLTVNLDKVTAAGANADENVDINGAGLTTVTVNTSGTASSFDVLDVASATTIAINAAVGLTATSLETGATSAALTITGAGAVNVGTLDTAINKVTATDASGALTAAIGGEVDTVITLGSGNDVITAGTTDAPVTVDTLSVNAGAGTGDVLVIVETADVNTAADAARYTNFETIRTADSVDMSLVAGITGLQVTAATNETFSNMSATQAAGVVLMGSQTTNVTFGVSNASVVGNLDTLALTVTDGASATSTITAANLTAAGVETVTINAVDNFTATVLTGLGALTKMTVTGGGDVSLTTDALALNVNTVIDASALTGAYTLVASGGTTNGISIKGSATKANTITGTNQDDVILGGTGVDTVKNQANAATDSDTVDFVSDSSADVFEITTATGLTTISNFDVATTTTTEDTINVSADSLDGTEVSITAAAAQGLIGSDRTIVIGQTVGAAAALTTSGTATLATSDFTAATLTNVAAYLSERFTGDNDTVADETALVVLNNGTNSYLYAYADSTTANTTIDAGELILIGVVSGAILNAGDVSQS